MQHKRIECRISGRVQMVMFRDFTARTARSLGITGFIKNNDDGSVSCVAEGSEDQLKALLKRLDKGSIFSRVDRVDTSWSDAQDDYHDFSIRYKE